MSDQPLLLLLDELTILLVFSLALPLASVFPDILPASSSATPVPEPEVLSQRWDKDLVSHNSLFCHNFLVCLNDILYWL